MDDSVARLKAGLGADEARANAMQHFTVPEQPYYSCPGSLTEPLGDLPWGEGACDCFVAQRKARALREVTAKREILRRCAARMDEMDVYPNGLVSPRALLARQILAEMTAVYSDDDA